MPLLTLSFKVSPSQYGKILLCEIGCKIGLLKIGQIVLIVIESVLIEFPLSSYKYIFKGLFTLLNLVESFIKILLLFK